MASVSGSTSNTVAEIANTLGITKTQAQAWLKVAIQQEMVVKSTRSVRYRCTNKVLGKISSRKVFR